MKIILRALGAALFTAGLLAVPAVAQAAEDAPLFGALTERDTDGKTVVYPIHPGESVPVVLGVTNRGTAPAQGVVVNVRVFDDLGLPESFTNCRYYVDSNLTGAWCEFDGDLPVGGTYALAHRITAEPDAKKISTVVFQWFPKDWVDEAGGIDGFAKRDSGQGTTPVTGSGAVLALQPKELPVPAETARVGFARLSLVTPSPGPSPSGSASAPASVPAPAPTSADPAPTTTTPPADGEGGGLPVTGTNVIVIAGVGGLLLLLGGIAFVATRRRNKFTA